MNNAWLYDLLYGCDAVRTEVILNMAFNLGLTRLQKFKKMIAALRIRDYETAAIEMKDSKWYNQVGSRAKRLTGQMRTGKRK